jgi:hypothetical protein
MNETEARDHRMTAIEMVIVITLVVVIVSLVTASFVGITFQQRNYRSGIAASLHAPVNHAAIIAYGRAFDFALVRTAIVFTGFMLAFIGAMYVLRSANEIKYGLEFSDKKGVLQTTSPGLVMITLGSAIVIAVLITHNELNYNAPQTWDPPKIIERQPATILDVTKGEK